VLEQVNQLKAEFEAVSLRLQDVRNTHAGAVNEAKKWKTSRAAVNEERSTLERVLRQSKRRLCRLTSMQSTLNIIDVPDPIDVYDESLSSARSDNTTNNQRLEQYDKFLDKELALLEKAKRRHSRILRENTNRIHNESPIINAVESAISHGKSQDDIVTLLLSLCTCEELKTFCY
jgi:uncharacterized protein (DUF3084 family)